MNYDNAVLVVTGNDPTFQIDISAFRGIRDTTDMRFSRLNNPTKEQFRNHIHRLRMDGDGKLPNIHIATHMSEKGIEFRDGILSPSEALSLLSGAPIIFLAGCESIEIADRLRLVPYVLSLTEQISNDDALSFALAFWAKVAQGNNAQEAFDKASEEYPTISEFAYLQSHSFLA